MRVTLTGKCDSHCHSSTIFGKNVRVVEITFQMLERLLEICDQERASPPSIKIMVLTFLVKKTYSEAKKLKEYMT